MATEPGKDARPRLERPGARIAFVVSSFHHELTGAMHASAVRELLAAGLSEDDLLAATVPGAFELPLVARRFARRPDVDAVICLGLVLKGETSHDVYVARSACDGIGNVALETDTPVLFGVLTCDTLEQARARALPPEQGGRQDKGRELACAALEVLAALDATEERSPRSVGFPDPVSTHTHRTAP